MRPARALIDLAALRHNYQLAREVSGARALAVIKAAGVGEVWSTDCIAHPSNAIAMAPLLAAALQPLLSA